MKLLSTGGRAADRRRPRSARRARSCVRRSARMVHGIELIAQRARPRRSRFSRRAEREHPNSVEIVYALGEAQWHGQQLERGVATLERAFQLDPRWQMALHHVVEFRLSRGEAAKLAPIASALRAVDRAGGGGARLPDRDRRARVLRGGGRSRARRSRAASRSPSSTSASRRRTMLAGDLDAAERAAKHAFELWPIDLREWGGFAHLRRALLYRGRSTSTSRSSRSKPSRQRRSRSSLWQPEPAIVAIVGPTGAGHAHAAAGAATWILGEQRTAATTVDGRTGLPRARGPRVRQGSVGRVPRRPRDGDREYREALDLPAKGDIRMLVAHHLARVLHAQPATSPARRPRARRCIAPRVYQAYRAVRLPDCLAWSGDPLAAAQLVDAWRAASRTRRSPRYASTQARRPRRMPQVHGLLVGEHVEPDERRDLRTRGGVLVHVEREFGAVRLQRFSS